MRSDEDQAFREWVDDSWATLFHTAYLLLGDRGHAEDLLLMALARIHRRWSRLDRPDIYTRRVLINLARTGWRRKRVREHLAGSITDDVAHGAGKASDPFERSDQRDELWRLLLGLPERMRAVLVLRYFEDLSEADTAAVLGCSIGTVKSQASRGLDRLRASYATEEAAASPGNGSSRPTGATT